MSNKQKILVPLLMTGTLLFSTVASANIRPVAEKQNVTVAEDSSQAITLVASDEDGDTLTYKIVRKPRRGTLSKVSENEYTYTPKADFSGTDQFLFRVNDGKKSSRLTRVKITVTESLDGIEASNISVTGKENTITRITLKGSGIDTTSRSNYSIVTQPAHGTVTIRNNKAMYKPNPNFNGADSFTYIFSDGVENSTPATISLDISAVNTRPTSENLSLVVVKNNVKEITLSGSDIEDLNLPYNIVRKPRKGTLSHLANGTFEYTPKVDFTGKDSFSYRLVDSEGRRSKVARVRLDILDHIPTAGNINIKVTKNETKQITLKGNDIVDDNATLVYKIVNQPDGVLGNLIGATLDYTPLQDYTGDDSFTYQVINSEGGISTVANVQLEVVEDKKTEFSGVKKNLEINSLKGWEICHAQPYGSRNGNMITNANNKCHKNNWMLACRKKGANTLQLAAYAPKADVMFETGKGNTVHNANGTAWYFNNSYSWGFAEAGRSVRRQSCDTAQEGKDYRLCWHTTNSSSGTGGWRCGSDVWLNGDNSFEKVILQAD